MAELVPGLEYAEFVTACRAYRDERDFRGSPFFARWGAALETLLETPRVETVAQASVPARRSLRVAQWNIEKGLRLEGLARRFRDDPRLSDADVITLQETDIGMARAGNNADVARVLAEAWGGHSIYLPSYIECTKGPPEDAKAAGENERGLHGLTILTRLPVRAVARHPLPPCWDYFDFWEKRFGIRQGLYALLEAPFGPCVVGTTHLEVRRTPACRDAQFAAFLEGLDAALTLWGPDLPVVLTGDWNTNSFPRGGWGRSVAGFLRILSTPRERLSEELVRPETREPLFARLDAAGFVWDAFNDRGATGWQRLGEVEDLSLVPRPCAQALMRAVGLEGRVLGMRLDWIAARGMVATASPETFPADGLSDHSGLTAELAPRVASGSVS